MAVEFPQNLLKDMALKEEAIVKVGVMEVQALLMVKAFIAAVFNALVVEKQYYFMPSRLQLGQRGAGDKTCTVHLG